MKKNVMNCLAVAMAVFAIFSCKKEQLFDSNIDEAGFSGPVTLVFSLSEKTRADFDQEGIKWEVGDVIRYTDKGLGNVKDITLEAGDLVDDYTASVKTAGLYLLNGSVFRHNWSPRNAAEWDFGYMGNYAGPSDSFVERNKLTIEQPEAGHINSNFVFLHSGMTFLDLSAAPSIYNVSMEILGTILRVLPYTNTYNGESVQKVLLTSTDRLGGVVSVNYAAGTYREHKDINWGPDTFKDYEVNLGTAFSLATANSKANSKGIYFSLPGVHSGHEINGYTFVVTTDVATYYFFATTNTLGLTNNKVRNVYLKLENGVRVLNANIDPLKQLTYSGVLSDNVTYSASAVVNEDLGWYAAYISDDGGTNKTVKEADVPANADYYDVNYSVVNPDDGSAISWLNVAYAPNSTHILLSADANGSQDRRGRAIITYPISVDGYTIVPSYRTKVIDVLQYGTSVITASLSVSSTSISKDRTEISGTVDILVDGVSATPSQFDYYSSFLELSADNETTVVREGKTLTITVPANPTDVARSITVTASIRGSNVSQVITQAKGVLRYVYTITKYNGNGNGAVWGIGTSATNIGDFAITDASYGGSPVDLTDSDIQNAIIAQAFSITEPEPGDMAAGYDGYSFDPDALTMVPTGTPTSTRLEVGVHSWATAVYRAKISWLSYDGSVIGSWFVFIP